MVAMRALLYGRPAWWITALQRVYLTNLDWLLMTYTTIVGFTYALGYHREVQVRGIRRRS